MVAKLENLTFIMEIILDNKTIMAIINGNFVKINIVIVLKTKCIVMEKNLNGCIQIAKELSKYTAKMRKNGQFLVGGNIVGIVIHFANQKVGY